MFYTSIIAALFIFAPPIPLWALGSTFDVYGWGMSEATLGFNVSTTHFSVRYGHKIKFEFFLNFFLFRNQYRVSAKRLRE